MIIITTVAVSGSSEKASPLAGCGNLGYASTELRKKSHCHYLRPSDSRLIIVPQLIGREEILFRAFAEDSGLEYETPRLCGRLCRWR